MIKLKCSNDNCNYCYQVTQKELEDNPQYYKVCLICGSRMKIDNYKEIIKFDLYKKAEEYLNKWFTEFGIEGTLELIERNKNQACYRIYKEILEKKGFRIN